MGMVVGNSLGRWQKINPGKYASRNIDLLKGPPNDTLLDNPKHPWNTISSYTGAKNNREASGTLRASITTNSGSEVMTKRPWRKLFPEKNDNNMLYTTQTKTKSSYKDGYK